MKLHVTHSSTDIYKYEINIHMHTQNIHLNIHIKQIYTQINIYKSVFPLGCSSCWKVSLCLPAPEQLFRLKYTTVHLCTVMSREMSVYLTYEVSQALGKHTFIEHNKSVIFKTIIDNNLTKNILTTNHIQ